MFHRLISTDGQFIALKLISSPYCAVSGFVYEFCSVSCKTSQNVAFRSLLTWSKFKVYVNLHYRCEDLRFILSGISLDENLHSCENQWRRWKKHLKGLKDKVCGSKRITSIRIPLSEPFIMFINIRVLRLRNTDWKSSLRLLQTFAGVLQKKNCMRSVLNETTTNYISIERL